MTVQDQLPATDLADADRLISDLAALVEAGVVVVHEHVLGPARYGLTCGEGVPAPGSSRSKDALTRGLTGGRWPTV